MEEVKVVLVTGASSGIGRDISLYLAKSGYKIVAAARRMDKLNSLCEEINGFEYDKGQKDLKSEICVKAMAVELDVGAEEVMIEKAVKNAWNVFGKIDVLINNAGIRGGVHSPLDWSEDDWENNIRSNLTGLWLVSKHVCRRMRDSRIKGSVINISSVGGLDRGQSPGAIAYVASKTGVMSVTRVMALELGKYNIRVNAVAPGLFKSEITEALMNKNWINDVAERIVPLKSFGTTEPAVTSVVGYLIQEASEYVSGNVFIADAGLSLPGIPIFSSL